MGHPKAVLLCRERLYCIKNNKVKSDGFNFDPATAGQTWPEGDLIFTKQ